MNDILHITETDLQSAKPLVDYEVWSYVHHQIDIHISTHVSITVSDSIYVPSLHVIEQYKEMFNED